jgi:hypothetical protein
VVSFWGCGCNENGGNQVVCPGRGEAFLGLPLGSFDHQVTWGVGLGHVSGLAALMHELFALLEVVVEIRLYTMAFIVEAVHK